MIQRCAANYQTRNDLVMLKVDGGDEGCVVIAAGDQVRGLSMLYCKQYPSKIVFEGCEGDTHEGRGVATGHSLSAVRQSLVLLAS